MNGFNSKMTGWLALLVGATGLLSLVSLILFFVGFFEIIPALSFMGSLNDALGSIAGILSAVLATALYQPLGRGAPRLSLVLLIGVWTGAIAITFGSWLIMTDRSGVELSSYYFFFGNGLIGIWVWVLNRITRQQAVWPRNLTQLGWVASVFMMVGLLGLYGILLRSDGDDFSPLVMVTGLSYLGTGILYPIWCLWLGRWLLSQRSDRVSVAQG